MHVSGGYRKAENEIPFITGGSGYVGKLLFMLPLMEQSAFRIGGAFGYLFGFSFARSSSVTVVARIIVVFMILQRLFAILLPVAVDLLVKLLLVTFCFYY